VPSEALIRTGRRSVVVVAQGDGKFTSVDVEAGTEANGQTEIRKGLEGGQKVVVSGQFLIDSEASLRATETRMGEAPASPEASGEAAQKGTGTASSKSTFHKGTGKVRVVNPPSGYVELDHDPIPSLQWPRMSMGFHAEDKSQLWPLKEGDHVEFELNPKPNKDGNFVLHSIRRAPGT
jgi:Cu(I)/Ag(I) efflux system membrane fusion protein